MSYPKGPAVVEDERTHDGSKGTPEPSVLFVGLNYAPEPTGISPYTTGMAVGLAERGWKVRAITAYPHYPWWSVPAEYQGLPTASDADGVRLRRLALHVPEAPGTVRRALFEIEFGLRAAFSPWGRPDVVVAVSPALLASCVVALRARLQGIPVVTWVQDIYTLGMTETDAGKGAKLIGAAERWLMNASERVTVIHDRFRRALADKLDVRRPIDVVRNWSHVPVMDTSNRAATRAALGWRDDEVIVLHAGAMGAKQGLENVVEAAAQARDTGSPVRFVLLGDGNQRRALEDLDTAGAVTFIDPLPDAEFERALVAADALLVNERPGLTDMSVPSKLTTYFATGLPVIAAVDTSSTTYGEMLAADAGPIVPAADPASVVLAAEALASDPERARAHGRSAQTYRERLLTAGAAVTAFEGVLRAAAHARARRR
jgi:colanic acid biosynthesis glycosyl transferase WcaI